MKPSVWILLVVPLFHGCGKGGGEGGSRVDLPTIGLTIEVPKGALLRDATETGVEVFLENKGVIEIERDDDFDPATADQYMQEMNDFKVTETPQGHLVTYSYVDGSTGESWTYNEAYLVTSIDGKKFRCGWASGPRRTADDANWAIERCKTLRKK